MSNEIAMTAYREPICESKDRIVEVQKSIGEQIEGFDPQRRCNLELIRGGVMAELPSWQQHKTVHPLPESSEQIVTMPVRRLVLYDNPGFHKLWLYMSKSTPVFEAEVNWFADRIGLLGGIRPKLPSARIAVGSFAGSTNREAIKSMLRETAIPDEMNFGRIKTFTRRDDSASQHARFLASLKKA